MVLLKIKSCEKDGKSIVCLATYPTYIDFEKRKICQICESLGNKLNNKKHLIEKFYVLSNKKDVFVPIDDKTSESFIVEYIISETDKYYYVLLQNEELKTTGMIEK